MMRLAVTGFGDLDLMSQWPQLIIFRAMFVLITDCLAISLNRFRLNTERQPRERNDTVF